MTGTSEQYAYDSLYQPTQVTQGALTTESYAYDQVRNRVSSLGQSPYTYNVSNELLTAPRRGSPTTRTALMRLAHLSMFMDGILRFKNNLFQSLNREDRVKKRLIAVFLSTVLVTAIFWDIQRGCGAALSALFEVLGWRIVAALFGPVFSDMHMQMVSMTGALLNGICITVLLGFAGLIAKMRGYFFSTTKLTVVFTVSAIFYLALVLLAFPMQKCP